MGRQREIASEAPPASSRQGARNPGAQDGSHAVALYPSPLIAGKRHCVMAIFR
jgi:hypothetical protein